MLSAQVHAAKILAGKCIVFNDHKLFLALFDMPKAFDSCQTIWVFGGNSSARWTASVKRAYCRLTVICDSASYYPRELPKRCTFHLLFEVCTNPRSELLQDTLPTKPKYADVITYVTNVEIKYQQIKIEILSLLEVGDLKVNHSKTELKFPNHLLHNLLEQHFRYCWHTTRHAGQPLID